MNWKNLTSTISLWILLILAPFFTVLGSTSLLHGNHDHGDHGHSHGPTRAKTPEEQQKIDANALRSSWYELLNASELNKKQDIQVFRLPEDEKANGTGLTVLWGTWFQFNDVNGDTWNVNAPFSYSQHERAGNYDEKDKEEWQANNVKRLAENIFSNTDLFALKEPGQKRQLTDAKQTALKELFAFEDIPIKLDADTLNYVANFESGEYLRNPGGYVHYQKLIATPKKSAKSDELPDPKDLPFLAGYEADELFFNWHPKLRGVQLVNTKPNSKKFYQFSLNWKAWGNANKAKHTAESDQKIASSNLPLLRARLVIHQLTKNVTPAEEPSHEDTTDANRLAWLLQDHKDYADHHDHEDEDGGEPHEHHEFKAADIFAEIFTSGENDEAFTDWMITRETFTNPQKMVDEINELLKLSPNLENVHEALNDMAELMEDMTPGQKEKFNEQMQAILTSWAPEEEEETETTGNEQPTAAQGTEGGTNESPTDPEEPEDATDDFPLNESTTGDYIAMIEAALNAYVNGWVNPEERDTKTVKTSNQEKTSSGSNTNQSGQSTQPAISELCKEKTNGETTQVEEVSADNTDNGEWEKGSDQCTHFLELEELKKKYSPWTETNHNSQTQEPEEPEEPETEDETGGDSTNTEDRTTEQWRRTNWKKDSSESLTTTEPEAPEFIEEATQMVDAVVRILRGPRLLDSLNQIVNEMAEITKDMAEDKKTKFNKVMQQILASLKKNNNPAIAPPTNSLTIPAWEEKQKAEAKKPKVNPTKKIKSALKTWKENTKETLQTKMQTVKPVKKSINLMFATVHVLQLKHLFEIKKPALAIFLTSAIIAVVGSGVLASYLFYFDKNKLTNKNKTKNLVAGSITIFGVIGLLAGAIFWVTSSGQGERLGNHNNEKNHVGHIHPHDHDEDEHEDTETTDEVEDSPTENENTDQSGSLTAETTNENEEGSNTDQTTGIDGVQGTEGVEEPTTYSWYNVPGRLWSWWQG